MKKILYGLVAAMLVAAPAAAENSKSGQPTLRQVASPSAQPQAPSSRALAPGRAGQRQNFISTFESSDADFIYRSMQYGRPNRR